MFLRYVTRTHDNLGIHTVSIRTRLNGNGGYQCSVLVFIIIITWDIMEPSLRSYFFWKHHLQISVFLACKGLNGN